MAELLKPFDGSTNDRRVDWERTRDLTSFAFSVHVTPKFVHVDLTSVKY